MRQRKQKGNQWKLRNNGSRRLARVQVHAVSTKTLWAPVKVDNTATKGVKDTYFALAVVGNRENAEKCNQAKACLPHKELFLHYRDFKALPQSFVDEFWGKQKLTDPGQKRFSTGG